VTKAQELCRANGIGDELYDHRRICMAITYSMGSIWASALATDERRVDRRLLALTADLTPPSAVSDTGGRPTGRSMRVLNGGIELHGNDGERGFGPDGRPIGPDGFPLTRTTPVDDWSARAQQKASILVAAPRLGAARPAPAPHHAKGATPEPDAAEIEFRRFQRRADKKA